MAKNKSKELKEVEIPALNINGKQYEIEKLSDTVKSLIAVYTTWQEDLEASRKALNDAKLSIAKNEAALRDLSKEIVDMVEATMKEEEEKA